jgi:hypothetical protein
MICRETLALKFGFSEKPHGQFTETVDLDGESLSLGVTALPRG